MVTAVTLSNHTFAGVKAIPQKSKLQEQYMVICMLQGVDY
jgi:hypothetical protein